MLKGVDLVTSNVPGAPIPIYIAGGQVEALFAFGPMTGAAANLTLLSYLDDLHIGINLDPAAVTEPDRLVAALRAGWDELLAVAAPASPSRRRAEACRSPGAGEGEGSVEAAVGPGSTPAGVSTSDLDVDVLVVGGGPAGAAAAMELARAGREVALVDKATFPRDKTCGDGLTTGALRHLEHLGARARRGSPSWHTVDDHRAS